MGLSAFIDRVWLRAVKGTCPQPVTAGSGRRWRARGRPRPPQAREPGDEPTRDLQAHREPAAVHHQGRRAGTTLRLTLSTAGLLVLSESWELESSTPGTARWMSEMPDGDWEAGDLPSSMLAVAGQALRRADRSDESGKVAVARVLARSETWVVLHGAPLVGTGADASP